MNTIINNVISMVRKIVNSCGFGVAGKCELECVLEKEDLTCLEANLICEALEIINLYGSDTLIERVFAERNLQLIFNHDYFRSHIFPEFEDLSLKWEQEEGVSSEDYERYCLIDDRLRKFVQWWAYYNLPSLTEIIDKVTVAYLSEKDYLYVAEDIINEYLTSVKFEIGNYGRSTFEDTVLQYITDYNYSDNSLKDFDITELGYEEDSYEAFIWGVFCESSIFSEVIMNYYEDFVIEVCNDILADY